MPRRSIVVAVVALVLAALPVPGAGPAAATSIVSATTLTDLGGSVASPRDVNDAGVVVGTATTTDGASRAVRWDAGTGAVTELAVPLAGASSADHVNAGGDAAGAVFTDVDGFAAFRVGAGATDAVMLPTIRGRRGAWASGITDDGRVVGHVCTCGQDATLDPLPVVWSADGTPQALDLAGAVEGLVHDVSPDRWATGTVTFADGSRVAALWQLESGTVTLLRPPAGAAAPTGVRVGEEVGTDPGTAPTVAANLNGAHVAVADQLVPLTLPAGATFAGVVDVAAGRILGWATYADGDLQPVVWQPTDEDEWYPITLEGGVGVRPSVMNGFGVVATSGLVGPDAVALTPGATAGDTWAVSTGPGPTRIPELDDTDVFALSDNGIAVGQRHGARGTEGVAVHLATVPGPPGDASLGVVVPVCELGASSCGGGTVVVEWDPPAHAAAQPVLGYRLLVDGTVVAETGADLGGTSFPWTSGPNRVASVVAYNAEGTSLPSFVTIPARADEPPSTTPPTPPPRTTPRAPRPDAVVVPPRFTG